MDVTRLIMVAVGGQGNLLASRVLGEAAMKSGCPIRMSEIHGMAQRGGVVESALVFGDARSTIISDGEADILLGFEPAEALRALKRCSQKSTVITNTAPLPPFTAAIGQGVYPEIRTVCDIIRERVTSLISMDAARLASEAENSLAVNMVLVGALIGTNLLPLKAEAVRDAISGISRPAFAESNIRAFELGRKAAGARA